MTLALSAAVLLVLLTLNVNKKQKNKKLCTLVYKECTKVYSVQKIKKSVRNSKKKLYTFVH